MNIEAKNYDLNFIQIVIRKEFRKNEQRTPLTPLDCNILIKRKNITIYVERSNNRCFNDTMYRDNGCILIDSIHDKSNDLSQVLIIGLKELDITNDIIFSYQHMYFSHTFKNQLGFDIILNKFRSNGGSIYDMEYFTDSNNKRLIAFGFYAGIAGAFLGLLQYKTKMITGSNIINCKPFNSLEEMLQKFITYNITIHPTIAIIGNGRCAKGCIKLLEILNLKYTVYTREMSKTNLINSTIILNCIQSNEMIPPFITHDTLKNFTKLKVIVDISCDYNNINNPLPIYNECSTFENPIIKINDTVDLISIDNLPSLLPRESSKEFSKNLLELFLNDIYKENWIKVLSLYNMRQNSIKDLST